MFVKIKSTIFVIAGLTLVFSGCQSLEWTAPKIEPATLWLGSESAKKDEVAFGTPVRMAVIWNDTTLNSPGKKPVRGFGGRVYFYDDESKPIRVDGEFTVYGYDEDKSTGNTPDRKYVFKKSEFQKRFGMTDIGASYNVWVPWEKKGGARKTVALLPIFVAEDGTVVQGDQSLNTLRGKLPEPKLNVSNTEGYKVLGHSPAVSDQRLQRIPTSVNGHPPNSNSNQTTDPDDYNVIRVNHEIDTMVEVAPGEMRTTTIKVPWELGKRLSNQQWEAARHKAASEWRPDTGARTSPGSRSEVQPTTKPQPPAVSPSAIRRSGGFGVPGSLK